MDLATASRASKRLQAAGKKITTVTRVAHGTRGPQAKGARLFNSLFATHSDILIRVVCTHGLEAPDLWLRVRRTDMIYVLKVKLEIALATVVQKSLRAEDLDLEYKNMTLKDMRTFAMYHIVDGCELHASAGSSAHQPEKAFVPVEPECAARNSEPRKFGRTIFARDRSPRACAEQVRPPERAGEVDRGDAVIRHGQAHHRAARRALPGVLAPPLVPR